MPHSSRSSRAQQLAALAMLAIPIMQGTAACVAPPAQRGVGAGVVAPPPASTPTLELRHVLREDDWRYARAPVRIFEGRELHVGPPHQYGVESVEIVDGHLGTRALEVTVAPAHGPPMTHWTNGLRGEKLALLASGEVLLVMTLEEPLPNPFQLHARFDDEAAEALAAALEGRVPPPSLSADPE